MYYFITNPTIVNHYSILVSNIVQKTLQKWTCRHYPIVIDCMSFRQRHFHFRLLMDFCDPFVASANYDWLAGRSESPFIIYVISGFCFIFSSSKSFFDSHFQMFPPSVTILSLNFHQTFANYIFCFGTLCVCERSDI